MLLKFSLFKRIVQKNLLCQTLLWKVEMPKCPAFAKPLNLAIQAEASLVQGKDFGFDASIYQYLRNLFAMWISNLPSLCQKFNLLDFIFKELHL